MRHTFAISALRDKRARLAGEIEAAERKIAKQREDLAALDATLRLFHPDADPSHITSIRPVWRGVYFQRGQCTRLCLEALRDAGEPMPTRLVAEYVMRARTMDVADRGLRATVLECARTSLSQLAARGLVRKIVVEPEAWWGLVGE